MSPASDGARADFVGSYLPEECSFIFLAPAETANAFSSMFHRNIGIASTVAFQSRTRC